MHSIQTALQILLQTTRSTMAIRLLRSRVFRTPASPTLWNGYSWSLIRALLTRLNTHMLSKSMHLIQNHLAHLAYVLHDLEVEIEGCRAARLVRSVVPDVEVGVLEGGLD